VTYNDGSSRRARLHAGRAVHYNYEVDPLCAAVEQAWNTGIGVVIVAGSDWLDDTFGNQVYATVMAPETALT
jgi:serine protease AprX